MRSIVILLVLISSCLADLGLHGGNHHHERHHTEHHHEHHKEHDEPAQPSATYQEPQQPQPTYLKPKQPETTYQAPKDSTPASMYAYTTEKQEPSYQAPEEPKLSHQVPEQTTVDHHDQCVDVSRYGEVSYNITNEQVCSYQVNRMCVAREKELCIKVPRTTCELEVTYECINIPQDNYVRCDTTQQKPFTPKHCYDDGFTVLKEIKQMPVCHNVTKQVCDSEWEVNDEGEKVFVANNNCRDVTWDDCQLEDRVVEEQVPKKTCVDQPPTSFLEPLQKKEKVTSYSRQCTPTGGAVCTEEEATECTTVSWMDCKESVDVNCNILTIHTPQQEYEHLLRCNVHH